MIEWYNIQDYSNLYTSYLPIFSGNWSNSDNAGTFYLYVNYSTSNSNSNIGSHLVFSKNFKMKLKGSLPWLLPKHKSFTNCIGSNMRRFSKENINKGNFI